MMSLPEADDLRKLPLRAIVAYALRSGCRWADLLARLHPEIDVSQILELARRFVMQVDIDERDSLLALRVTEGIRARSATGRLAPDEHSATWALVAVATATFHAICAVHNPEDVDRYVRHAAREAERAARFAELLSDSDAAAAIDASVNEYQALLQRFGETNEIVVGATFDPDAILDSEAM